jgi:hypothetical protein
VSAAKPLHEKTRAFRLGSVADARVMATRLLEAVDPAYQDAGGGINREQLLWDSFMTCDDKRVQFEAFRLLLSYKYGRPIEKAEVKVDGPSYVAELPVKKSTSDWVKQYAGNAAPVIEGAVLTKDNS